MKYVRQLRTVLLLLAMLMGASSGWAQEEVRVKYFTNDYIDMVAVFNPEEGSLDFTMVIGTTFGGGGKNGRMAFNNGADVTIGDTKFNIKQSNTGTPTDKNNNVTVTGDLTLSDFYLARITEKESTTFRPSHMPNNDGENKLVACYRKPLKTSDLGKRIAISIKGKMWGQGTDRDVNINTGYTVPTSADILNNFGVKKLNFLSQDMVSKDGKAYAKYIINDDAVRQQKEEINLENARKNGTYVLKNSKNEDVMTFPLYASNILSTYPYVTEGKYEEWEYTTVRPEAQNVVNSIYTFWYNGDYSTTGWKKGKAPFGKSDVKWQKPIIKTTWNTGDIWLRKTLNRTLNQSEIDKMSWVMCHDEDIEIFVNGVRVFEEKGYDEDYKVVPLSQEAKDQFAAKNANPWICVHVKQTAGGQFFDLGLITLENSVMIPLGTEEGEVNPAYLDEMKLAYAYSPVGNHNTMSYCGEAQAIPTNSYPLPQEVKAYFDDNSREVRVEWEYERAPQKGYSSTDTNKSYDDIMRIIYKKGGEVVGTTDMEYKANVLSYSTSLSVPAGIEADYEVSIARILHSADGTTEIPLGEVKRTVGVNSNHYSANNLTAVVAESGTKIDLSWDIDGGVWSNGTKAYLSRYDESTGRTTEISLSKDKFMSQKFSDADLVNFHDYGYTLIVEPGGDYDKNQSNTTKAVTPYSPGTAVSTESSQGEFTDKINIKWQAKNFNVYSIERRRADDPYDDFSEIYRLDNVSTTSTNFSFVDELILPGVIYTYNIMCRNVDTHGNVLQEEVLTDYGFRKTAGDLNGKIVFEDGSAVKNADVRLTAYDEVKKYSLHFTEQKENAAHLYSDDIMTRAKEFSLQAMVRPESGGNVIYKKGVFNLGITEDGRVSVGAARVSVADSTSLEMGQWYQITATANDSLVKIYVNGDHVYTGLLDSISTDPEFRTPSAENAKIELGRNFNGYISEVRLWSRVLSDDEVANNYNRYIVGNEQGLEAYFNLSFACPGRLFDFSYKGTLYNRRHGEFNEEFVELDENVHPSDDMLAYAAKTDESGIYVIRNILYYGNGTSYKITPVLASHRFDPLSEVRFFSSTAANHTINYTDKSSFQVPIRVKYSGGDYPVEGVRFEIDGETVMKENKIVTTDANGEVTINVPIGYHKVQAIKEGHQFSQDGYLVDMEGNHLNYQNDMNVRTLSDSTRVLFVGRVAGGAPQGNKDLGFGLSKNNLSANSTVTFTPIKEHDVNTSGESIEYEYQHQELKIDEEKYKKALELGVTATKTNRNNNKNKVTWNKQNIIANVAEKTGEFYVWLLPERYTVSVKIPGQNDTDVNNIEGNNAVLDMTAVATSTINSILTDSVENKKTEERIVFSVTEELECTKSQAYTLRTKPILSAVQINDDGEEMECFGDPIFANSTLVGGETEELKVWNNEKKPGYYFDHPMLMQAKEYSWRLRMSEDYVHNETQEVDHVACDNVEYTINNKCAGKTVTLSGDDETGMAMYTFMPATPDMVTGKQTISIHATYGQSENDQTSIAWKAPFADKEGGQEMIIMGGVQSGSNFVTAGPENVLFVLRDPPGSQSYSSMSISTSWNEASTYKGGVEFTQNFAGETTIGAGNEMVIAMSLVTEMENSVIAGNNLDFKESYTGTNTRKRAWSTALSYKTSNSPSYVGADGDLYVGYSTNYVFGHSDQIMLVKGADYRANKGLYQNLYTPEDGDWVLASRIVTTMGDSVKTMFDYAQMDIEKIVIPNLISMRNGMFTDLIDGDFQKTEDYLYDEVYKPGNEHKIYYISKVDKSSPSFATKDNYACIHNVDYWSKQHKVSDVKSKSGENLCLYVMPDSVAIINQWIANWKTQIALNEEAKVKATDKVQNFSFSAGSSAIDYKESYSTSRALSNGFSITIGYAHTFGSKEKAKSGAVIEGKCTQKIGGSTNHGGTWDESATRSHTYGFVLQDTDKDDNLSVDVFREPKWNADKENYDIDYDVNGSPSAIDEKDSYSTFIFKKIGGATSLPYEDAQKVKYWSGHEGEVIDAATMHVDRPTLSISKTMTEGVPMGDVAYVDIEMGNNSEVYASRAYLLKPDDESVPDGLEITIDGMPVKHWPVYKIDYGQTQKKTLAIRSGKAMNYDNIRLILCANSSTPAIADKEKAEARFSVHFVPSSSPVTLTEPSGEWNYNTELPTMDHNGRTVHYMPVTISGYDINYPNFSHLSLQTKRKGQGDDKWIDQSTWTKEQLAEMNGTINYSLIMDDYADDEYELRAVTFSDINNIMYERSSEIRSGVKDMVCPRTYGEPSPVNGILTPGENIEITFNEPIAQGYVNKEYISVTGTLNGSIDNDYTTFVALDGWNGHLVSELEYNFVDNAVTIDMNIRPKKISDAVIFAHGGDDSNMELSITKDRHLQIKVDDVTITSAKPCSEEDLQANVWCNIALTFNGETSTVSAYCNGTPYILDAKINPYSATGPIDIGRSMRSENEWFHGDIASLRIWRATLNGAQIMEYSQRQLSGREPGLMSSYSIDEGKGSVLLDRTSGFNLMMQGNAVWTLPEGRSLQFDGKEYATIDATKSVVTSESDWTLQFWFRSIEGGKSSTILSTGEAAEGENVDMTHRFGIRLDDKGDLIYESAGSQVNLGSGYNNGDWHCVGVTLSRTTGFIRFYIDGSMVSYREADPFGGIQTSELTIGAKQTIYSSKTPTYSEFLTGSVDDIQLWNLCRTSRQMSQEYNREMTGKEVGLRGYWPFDYYHKWEQGTDLDTTMVNQADPDLTATGVRHGAQFSSKCAPVMDAQVAADIPFDFVTSERGIMIVPTAKRTAIQNRTLTISVRDIKDKHGNVMTNPYTWTALVRQDNVDWTSQNMSLRISNDEEYHGSLSISNKSGSDQSYSILAIPTWMHIEETEGICPAGSVKTLEFTVDKGLAIGNFDEAIYLNVEGQTPAPLYITARVRGNVPDWKPANPQSQFNCQIFGQMKFNGHFSDDTDDMIGAFLGNKCVGVAHTSMDYDLKMHYALLTINYDIIDTLNLSKLEFRAFDASTGFVYSMNPSVPIVVKNNYVYGLPSAPVIFSGTKEKILYYNLKAGWNWVSLPLQNAALADPIAAFDAIEGSFSPNDIFKSFDRGCKYTNAGEWNRPERFALNNREMYMILAKKDVSMQLRGTEVDNKNTVIKVNPRWNWISFLPTTNLSVQQALAGYVSAQGDIIKNAHEFAIYDKGFWVGSLKYMEPGCGYMLYNNSDEQKDFVYPSSSSVVLNSTAKPRRASYAPTSMNMVAEIADVQPGDILVAHTRSCGDIETEPVTVGDKTLYFLSLSDDEGSALTFSVKRGEELVTAINATTYVGNVIDGSIDHPVTIITGESGTMTAYPVPAVTVVNIDYELDAAETVSFAIYDVNGRLVKTLPMVKGEAGRNTQQIDVTALSSGHYFVRKSVNGVSDNVRFIKK